jgi:hypothetical protein
MKKFVNILLIISALCVAVVLMVNLFALKAVTDTKMSNEESLAKARAKKAELAKQKLENENTENDEES